MASVTAHDRAIDGDRDGCRFGWQVKWGIFRGKAKTSIKRSTVPSVSLWRNLFVIRFHHLLLGPLQNLESGT